MIEKSCADFSKMIADKTPTPGGGAAAAYCGAVAVALGAMVGQYTLGNSKYFEVHSEIKDLLKESEEMRLLFLDLVEEDAKAFTELSKVYSMSKDDPTRGDLFEVATVTAATPPFNMVRLCALTMDVLRQYQLKGSKMLLSDVACAASLCRAAMESAAINVFVNTKMLLDRDTANQMESEVDSLLEKAIPLAKTIVTEISESIRG